MDTYLGIDNNRLLHSRAVGERAAAISHDLFAWDDNKCQAMFILGFLHDIGYQYSHNQLEHEHIGGMLLKDVGYQYWQEIYYHGVPSADYFSDELFVLNLADMETSNDGQHVSMSERLAGIATRYGTNSEQYTKAALLVQELTAHLEELES